MKDPRKLFEKFDRCLNRQTQQNAWDNIITDLSRDEIFVPSGQYLRKRVTNWIQRATVRDFFPHSYIQFTFLVFSDIE